MSTKITLFRNILHSRYRGLFQYRQNSRNAV